MKAIVRRRLMILFPIVTVAILGAVAGLILPSSPESELPNSIHTALAVSMAQLAGAIVGLLIGAGVGAWIAHEIDQNRRRGHESAPVPDEYHWF
jgi:hypothetical protein